MCIRDRAAETANAAADFGQATAAQARTLQDADTQASADVAGTAQASAGEQGPSANVAGAGAGVVNANAGGSNLSTSVDGTGEAGTEAGEAAEETSDDAEKPKPRKAEDDGADATPSSD